MVQKPKLLTVSLALFVGVQTMQTAQSTSSLNASAIATAMRVCGAPYTMLRSSVLNSSVLAKNPTLHKITQQHFGKITGILGAVFCFTLFKMVNAYRYSCARDKLATIMSDPALFNAAATTVFQQAPSLITQLPLNDDTLWNLASKDGVAFPFGDKATQLELNFQGILEHDLAGRSYYAVDDALCITVRDLLLNRSWSCVLPKITIMEDDVANQESQRNVRDKELRLEETMPLARLHDQAYGWSSMVPLIAGWIRATQLQKDESARVWMSPPLEQFDVQSKATLPAKRLVLFNEYGNELGGAGVAYPPARLKFADEHYLGPAVGVSKRYTCFLRPSDYTWRSSDYQYYLEVGADAEVQYFVTRDQKPKAITASSEQ